MIRDTLSQLTCLYQFDLVIGVSVMCVFLGSYLLGWLGSDALAIDDGGDDMYSGLTARSPAVGWGEGLMSIASEGG